MRLGDAFSGILGFSLGFEQADFEPVWAAEKNPYAQTVIKKHRPKLTLYDDVNEVNPDGANDVDIIVGGPPCQSFSMAGGREGLAGESRQWFTYLDLIRRFKPKWLVFENVMGVLSSGPKDKGGQTIRGVDFAIILAGLGGVMPTIPPGGWRRAGFMRGAPGYYNVAWRVLDSRYFGLPQGRKRIFLVASIGSGACAEVLFDPGDGSKKTETGARTREKNTEATPNCTGENGRYRTFSWQTNDANGTRRDRPNGGLYIRETNTSLTIGSRSETYVVTPAQRVRRLTLTEWERLQGFPDGWTNIDQPVKARQQQIRNAVPVPVARWIAERIMEVDKKS